MSQFLQFRVAAPEVKYEYCQPDPRLHDFIGSYYVMHMPDGGGDVVRAEIPHIRIVLGGQSVLSHGDDLVTVEAPAIVVCGPATRAGSVSVSPGTLIVGISVLPAGWQAMFGISAAEIRDRKILADDLVPICPDRIQDQLLSAPDDRAMFRRLDDVLLSLVAGRPFRDLSFLQDFEAWCLAPGSPGVDQLRESSDLSARRLDRLCKQYFGASPKRLHRKYRALQTVHRIARTGSTDWRDVAGDSYYDQAHFIKDFREIVGCTPGTLMGDSLMMIRFDLLKRLSVRQHSRLALIG